VGVGATKMAGEKTSQAVCFMTEIALVHPVADCPAICDLSPRQRQAPRRESPIQRLPALDLLALPRPFGFNFGNPAFVPKLSGQPRSHCCPGRYRPDAPGAVLDKHAAGLDREGQAI